MRDYGKILEVLKAARKPLCPFEFASVQVNPHYTDSSQVDRWWIGREWIGQTESTISRRLREAAALGLVVPSKRQAQNGAVLVQYSLPGIVLTERP
jgi:hypothetical protein